MIKRLCAASAVLAAVAGAALMAVPAHADTWSDNWSSNSDSWQAGNNFGDVSATNRGGWDSTGVNNVNGIATTATDGGIAVTYVFH
ncbi:MAG: hypothetical protein HOV96_02740 [Nonomuraea sp.]|nr:hypothetical protein [Nonomuraea sp.]NUP66241.1 hypothetical protein [Nonomuraea sp.]NUP76448.1 hypothetical protein [Nonomuraea sp.]NUS06268.1 hypothetical protein [Nonomuraea sp.]